MIKMCQNDDISISVDGIESFEIIQDTSAWKDSWPGI